MFFSIRVCDNQVLSGVGLPTPYRQGLSERVFRKGGDDVNAALGLWFQFGSAKRRLRLPGLGWIPPDPELGGKKNKAWVPSANRIPTRRECRRSGTGMIGWGFVWVLWS